MTRPPKVHINNTVLFVTTSIEQGIMLPANPVMNEIILSTMAQAQELHPVRICHFLVNGNHLHFIFAVENPEDISDFMERFKTESSHRINRLIDRTGHRVWCAGYYSSTVLIVPDVRREIAYIYGNIAKDGIEDSINLFPGQSSWRQYNDQNTKKISGDYEIKVPRYSRLDIPVIGRKAPSYQEQKQIAYQMRNDTKKTCILRITPDAWMKCFGINTQDERSEHNNIIVSNVYKKEAECRAERLKENKRVIGCEALKRAWVDTEYESSRSGKRSFCICSDIAHRIKFLTWIKALIAQAREVYARWKRGDFSVPFPLGLYPPPKPRLANLVPKSVLP